MYPHFIPFQELSKRSFIGSVVVMALLLVVILDEVKGEGSGDWGTDSNRQSWLWVPSNSATANQGYGNRGYMLLPSSTPGYNSSHRLFVYVKAGETVFFGFRRTDGSTSNVRVQWFYDSTTSDFFPSGTSGSSRVEIFNAQYRLDGTNNANGKPGDALSAFNGPSQVTGAGYTGRSFVNNTGADRAFWVELSSISAANLDFWDITVASGSSGSYVEHKGRVYCKYWSIANSRSSGTSTGLNVASGTANDFSFHENFGFYIPIDNTYSGPTGGYFVKRIRVPGASGGWTNFFANDTGPRETGSVEENRRSIEGVSNLIKYPLFINNPDESIWPSSTIPTASIFVDYSEKSPPQIGGQAFINVDVTLPAIVDVLIDINNNGVYDPEMDIIITESYSSPGSYEIYWNGEDASGSLVPFNTEVNLLANVMFFPVHFPIFDLEQSLGVFISNIRPGSEKDDDIFWDDILIPRTNITPSNSARSIVVNITGLPSPEHIWWATGDNGFGNNKTINTWAGASYLEIKESFIILPVSWLYFGGRPLHDKIRLDWELSKDHDGTYYVVERSGNGRDWEILLSLQGMGASTERIAYVAWDEKPEMGKNFYRIVRNDEIGRKDFSEVIRVDFERDLDFNSYPNPFKNELVIEARLLDQANVFLSDVQGRVQPVKIKSQNPGKIILDVSELPFGFYVLHYDLDNKVFSKKLVKSP